MPRRCRSDSGRAVVALGGALALGATIGVAFGAGCAATPIASELVRAQALEAAHDDQGAIALYDAMLWTCEHGGMSSGRDDCGDAASRKALLLEPTDVRAAYAAWAVAIQVSKSRRTQARALVRAATIAEELDQKSRALELAWQCVESFPDEMPSEDALKLVVRAAPRDEVLARLATLYARWPGIELADDLLFAQFRLRLAGGEVDQAIAIADELWTKFPRSSLRDDALWESALRLRAEKRPRDAMLRLQRLLDTRRDAYLAGSYNSEFLDDAQLEKGKIARDELHDTRLAIDSFRGLVTDWPESRLRDDAQIEWAATLEATDVAAACKLYAEVPRKFPDGNQIAFAAKRRLALACGDAR